MKAKEAIKIADSISLRPEDIEARLRFAESEILKAANEGKYFVLINLSEYPSKLINQVVERLHKNNFTVSNCSISGKQLQIRW